MARQNRTPLVTQLVATQLVAIMLLCVPTLPSRAASPINNPWRTGRTLVIPHAGGDGLFPENTMLAYELTQAMGADVVDVDVRLTADGVPVLMHDATVGRTTGATGRVASMTLAELEVLDAGATFTKGSTRPFAGKGLRIPTLEQVLERFPKRLLSIDLKDERNVIIAPVCSLLRKYHRQKDSFVGSNGDPVILNFRQQCPDIPTSAIMQDVYIQRDARATKDPNFQPAALIDQPPFRQGTSTLVTKDGLRFAHEHNISVLTWVVNNEQDLRRLVDIGVDGIYTSYPDRLLTIVGRLNGVKR